MQPTKPKPKVKIDRSLRPESKAQRDAGAKIGEADVARVQAFVAGLTRAGRTMDAKGRVVAVPGRIARLAWVGSK